MRSLREPTESDWPRIASIANRSVRHVPTAPIQTEWVENRLAFEGVRRHYVIEDGDELAGYGSVERRPGEAPGLFRLFLVLPWAAATSEATAEELFARLTEELTALGAAGAWLREYADDRPFIDFLLKRGFEVTREYEYDGQRLVDLASVSRFW